MAFESIDVLQLDNPFAQKFLRNICDIFLPLFFKFIKSTHLNALFSNRPIYRYGGHIEFIRFKEYYRMSRRNKHISFVFSSAFRDIFFRKFSQNKILKGKKILVPCLDAIMIVFFQFSIRNMVFHCIFLGEKAIQNDWVRLATACEAQKSLLKKGNRNKILLMHKNVLT